MADETKFFSCTYHHQGKLFGLTIEARSIEEVPAHLAAIGRSATVEGEQVLEVDGGEFGENLGRILAAAPGWTGGRVQ
jgi:hypothetical protein